METSFEDTKQLTLTLTIPKDENVHCGGYTLFRTLEIGEFVVAVRQLVEAIANNADLRIPLKKIGDMHVDPIDSTITEVIDWDEPFPLPNESGTAGELLRRKLSTEDPVGGEKGEDIIAIIQSKMIGPQEVLGKDFERILNDNIEDLIVKT
jgi:hypothetical protein